MGDFNSSLAYLSLLKIWYWWLKRVLIKLKMTKKNADLDISSKVLYYLKIKMNCMRTYIFK